MNQKQSPEDLASFSFQIACFSAKDINQARDRNSVASNCFNSIIQRVNCGRWLAPTSAKSTSARLRRQAHDVLLCYKQMSESHSLLSRLVIFSFSEQQLLFVESQMLPLRNIYERLLHETQSSSSEASGYR